MRIGLDVSAKTIRRIAEGKCECLALTKPIGKAGDYFLVGNEKYEIYATQELPLATVFHKLRGKMGIEDPYEFMSDWKKDHKKEWDPLKDVWVIYFREVPYELLH